MGLGKTPLKRVMAAASSFAYLAFKSELEIGCAAIEGSPAVSLLQGRFENMATVVCMNSFLLDDSVFD